uniref:Ribosomal RNA small subunit methyltransferase I n=1 Tax=Thermogemmatispora argillosa TaxID=2045280 RepID=A0A455T7C5_9CHLR|nr:ribosomal RNA small subunit methyltransferase I [Thermogemmatispora argillosa]
MSTLYLVATPIGNLGDITLRALEVLRSVDVIAAEDTRKTAILLRHYDIHKPQLAFYEHNEERAGRHIEALLKQGKSVALVTNAGTPGISDPGYTLVQRAIQAGIPVTMIPGPAAFVMALVLSGLPVHSFTFRGFPPRKAGRRRRFLEADRHSPYTLIYYESPYRLADLLRDALEVFGDRPAALANELTKLFEKVYRGTLSSLLETITQEKPRGEYVLVVAGASHELGAGAHEGPTWEESSPEEEGEASETEAAEEG